MHHKQKNIICMLESIFSISIRAIPLKTEWNWKYFFQIFQCSWGRGWPLYKSDVNRDCCTVHHSWLPRTHPICRQGHFRHGLTCKEREEEEMLQIHVEHKDTYISEVVNWNAFKFYMAPIYRRRHLMNDNCIITIFLWAVKTHICYSTTFRIDLRLLFHA